MQNLSQIALPPNKGQCAISARKILIQVRHQTEKPTGEPRGKHTSEVIRSVRVRETTPRRQASAGSAEFNPSKTRRRESRSTVLLGVLVRSTRAIDDFTRWSSGPKVYDSAWRLCRGQDRVWDYESSKRLRARGAPDHKLTGPECGPVREPRGGCVFERCSFS